MPETLAAPQDPFDSTVAAPSRTLPAKIAALSRWAYNREQGLAQLSKARGAFESRFANDSERRLYFVRLAQASVKARARRSRRGNGGAK